MYICETAFDNVSVFREDNKLIGVVLIVFYIKGAGGINDLHTPILPMFICRGKCKISISTCHVLPRSMI